MIGIVNYGSGNIQAVANIYKRTGVPYKIIHRVEDFKYVEKLILPGVGAFDATMDVLNKSGLREVLDNSVLIEKKPVLGICVGMQIMSEGSEEGVQSGLGWIKGRVKKFEISKLKDKPYIPHMGWNTIKQVGDSRLFEDLDQDLGFYFVHSYFFETVDSKSVLAKTFYGEDFSSAVHSGHIVGVQFHPEKSHSNGIRLLTNFIKHY
jgi:glutamine amidotransferase